MYSLCDCEAIEIIKVSPFFILPLEISHMASYECLLVQPLGGYLVEGRKVVSFYSVQGNGGASRRRAHNFLKWMSRLRLLSPLITATTLIRAVWVEEIPFLCCRTNPTVKYLIWPLTSEVIPACSPLSPSVDREIWTFQWDTVWGLSIHLLHVGGVDHLAAARNLNSFALRKNLYLLIFLEIEYYSIYLLSLSFEVFS